MPSPDVYQTPLARLMISPRTLNALRRADLDLVGDVVGLSDQELLSARNFNEKCLDELDRKLAELGLTRGNGFRPPPD